MKICSSGFNCFYKFECLLNGVDFTLFQNAILSYNLLIMSLAKVFYPTHIAALLLTGLVYTNCIAQPDYDDPNVGLKYNQRTFSNHFPCAECAVYDNNGNDLAGFIKSNKSDLSAKASLVNEYSNNTWGYLQIKDVKAPSLDREGNLNYYQAFDVTLGLYQDAGTAKATWWARETNAPRGALVNTKVDVQNKLATDYVKYTELLHEMESKKITLVEYFSDNYNTEDYDELFKNYILIKGGSLKDLSDYKKIIDYYNTFLSRFSSVSDPFLEHKSFITCLTVSGTKYIGCFNIVNAKLAGKLEPVNIQYDKDRDTVISNVFGKLTGTVVYVYGNDIFGMDKAMIKYGHAHNIKLIRRKPADNISFNEDK
jgi:hypothetical protein